MSPASPLHSLDIYTFTQKLNSISVLLTWVFFTVTHFRCNLWKQSWSLWRRESSHFMAALERQATGNISVFWSFFNWVTIKLPTIQLKAIFLPVTFSTLESELATVRQEKELLTQQLLNTIKHKVALSQELDAWQVRPWAESGKFKGFLAGLQQAGLQ